MNSFKKNIYKTGDEITISPPTSFITFEEDISISPNCYNSVTVTVNTTIEVKVDIISAFNGGATYFGGPFTPGATVVISNVINDVITSDKTYAYGIDAHNTNTPSDTFNSVIWIYIKDAIDDSIIESFPWTRTHDDGPHC